MDAGEVLIPITIFAGGFAMVFGIVYLKTRQNLAMIDKGMNPKEFTHRPAPFRNLKWALLLLGAGLGLFLAYLLDIYVFNITNTPVRAGDVYYHHDDNPAIYFALIAIGGGLGLFSSYLIERKWWDENKDSFDKQS